MSNNIYNILGKLKGITDTAAIAPETTTETVYESVEARGSITEAVKSLESKFAEFKESKAKPDFLDVDKDGNKKEPFKKAVKDKKAVKEGAKPDFLDMDKDGDKKEPMKKAAKDKNNAKGAMKDMFGGDAKDLTSKLKIKEGQGPYTLDDPKHPKFKANYEKFKKSNPDCKLADFVAAMKKKEKNLSEAAYDEPEAPNADAIAKRKRLQAIKDRQEDERAMGGSSETNTPIRKVAGKAYGGAAQPADSEFKDVDDDKLKKTFVNKQDNALDVKWNRKKEMGGGLDLDEVAPPGAKAERMVKHIKKGYSKDSKLTPKEKGIAYATAWKAHNKGQVEEGVKFGDKIANSTAELKKAKPAMVKESRVMEETDYFYEKVGKALCDKNPNLDTAGSEFADAVRKEMVAQGIQPNRARNILLMDEDFLMDVASSYGHYCKEVAESGVPMNSHLGGMEELDEIAALAGLSSPTAEQQSGLERSTEELDEREQFQSMPKTTAPTPAAPAASTTKPTYDKSKLNPMREEEVEEGNEFSGALAAAKASGAKEFEVDGKRYTVKEDINVNITANGQEDALNLFRKLAGMEEVTAQPVAQSGLRQIGITALPQDAESAIAQGIVEPVEVEVDEERDIEYANTPNEKIGPVGAAIPSGDDLHRSKKQFRKEYPGDNPMAVQESAEESLWKKYSGMLKSLIIK